MSAWRDRVTVDPSGCWLWTGCVQSSGYPSMCAGRKGVSVSVHRVSLAEKLGRPLTANALHTCDIKRCVNPEHLYEGSAADNSRDQVDRGRTTTGERNGRARITEAQAIRVMTVYRNTGLSASMIARAMGMPDYTARDIIAGRTWKHLTRRIVADTTPIARPAS